MNLWSDEQAGPNPYATGGFVVVTTLASVVWFDVRLKTAGANLGQALFDVALNTPAAGQVTITVKQETFDRQTTIGAVTGLPGGISLATVSGQQYAAGASHLHDQSHDHAVTPASGGPGGASANTLAAALQPAVTTHTHTVDLPNLVANTGAEATHQHVLNNLYAHTHGITNTQTDLALAELANGTNLSGSTLALVGGDA